MKALKILSLLILLQLAFGSKGYGAQVSFKQSQLDSIAVEERNTFLKYDYPETKDACKQFLTLVVGVLVFTLTFSEKIINFNTASKTVKGILITGWILFILSIVLCGLGIGEILLAAGKAVYQDDTYRDNESVAIYLIIISGISFVLGLVSLMIDGIIMVYHKPTGK